MTIKWRWSFSSPLDYDFCNARGTLLTSNKPLVNGYYKVKSIKGIYNDDKITGLADAEAPLPDYFLPDDKLIRTNKRGRPQLTSAGISFTLESDLSSKIYFSEGVSSDEEGVNITFRYGNERPFLSGPELPPPGTTGEAFWSHYSIGVSFKAFIV